MNDDPLWLAQVAFAALADIAFASTLGAVLMNGWLSKEKAFATVSPARFGWRRARRVSFGGALLLACANIVSLWLQAASMSGVPITEAGASVWTVLTATHAGIGWAIGISGSVLLVLATSSGSPMSGARLAFVTFGALVAAAGKASIGHAADAGAFSVAEIMQTVHLLATAVWGGVVIAGALAVLPALSTSLARAFFVRIARRVSAVSTVAVVFVIATGVYNALRGLGGSASVLGESVWGHVLIVKIVLVVAALMFGALNRWSALPRLQRTASTVDAHTFTNVMRVEAWLMLGVFVAASVLSHSVPGFASGG